MIAVDGPLIVISMLVFALVGMVHASEGIDEREAEPGQWGFRPKAGDLCAINPPNFSWRPQKEASTYLLQISQDDAFEDVVYEADDIVFNVHTPTRTLPPGAYYWRFRYINSAGEHSDWSLVREFSLDADVVEMPLPDKDAAVFQG